MDAALEKFPARPPGVLRQAAITAEQAGDMDRALQHWADIRTHFGDTNGGYNGALRTLARFRRLDLAMPLLNEGLEKFPRRYRSGGVGRRNGLQGRQRRRRRLLLEAGDEIAPG